MSVSHFRFRCGILRCLFVPLICAVPLHAADEPKKVLSTTTVNAGDHAIIFQRVEPPKEMMTPVMATPVPATVMSAAAREEALAKWTQQRSEMLSLSCTVYESGATSVRWWHNGAEYRILSSIDFNNLRGLGIFTSDGRNYMVFMGIGNQMAQGTLESLQADGVKLPASLTAPAPELPASVVAEIEKNGGSRYVIVSAPEKAEADAFNGINDLHRYYDAHKEELIAAWKQSETDRIAHEQWVKEHPPVPQDTVIQFWPKKGSRYLGKEAQ